jgi:hypothetical protein
LNTAPHCSSMTSMLSFEKFTTSFKNQNIITMQNWDKLPFCLLSFILSCNYRIFAGRNYRFYSIQFRRYNGFHQRSLP